LETTLNIQDFDFSNYFSLYPNPVNEELNIIAQTKHGTVFNNI
jgi:hypothetical protein